MAPLTRRERLIRAYNHQEMDRPGVFVRTAFPGNDAGYDPLKTYVRQHTELKGDWNSFTVQPDYPAERFVERASQDCDRHVTILHTPAGDLRTSTDVHRASGDKLHYEPLINTLEQAATYLSLGVPAMAGDVSSFFRQREQMGDEGILEAGLSLNPAGRVARICGSENFAIWSATDREVIHALCRYEMEMALARVRCLLAQGVGPYFAILGEEYIVPPLHGPQDFHDFNVRYDRPIAELIHEAGGRLHMHCHGRVKSVFGMFLEIGVDVLHPFEPPPMGDITAGEAKAMAGRRMTLEGNIQIGDMYDKSPGDIRRQTESLIADAFADRQGLIVCPTASPYMRGKGMECFPRFKAMIDAVLEWRH